jgi:hypothetical protein
MKMQRLVIEILEKDGKKFWRIKEQTHRGESFGRGGWFTFNRFELSSGNYPAEYGGDLQAYLRGDDETMDNEIVDVPSDAWLRRFESAIRAFNKHFSKPDKPKPKKVYKLPKGYKIVKTIK